MAEAVRQLTAHLAARTSRRPAGLAAARPLRPRSQPLPGRGRGLSPCSRSVRPQAGNRRRLGRGPGARRRRHGHRPKPKAAFSEAALADPESAPRSRYYLGARQGADRRRQGRACRIGSISKPIPRPTPNGCRCWAGASTRPPRRPGSTPRRWKTSSGRGTQTATRSGRQSPSRDPPGRNAPGRSARAAARGIQYALSRPGHRGGQGDRGRLVARPPRAMIRRNGCSVTGGAAEAEPRRSPRLRSFGSAARIHGARRTRRRSVRRLYARRPSSNPPTPPFKKQHHAEALTEACPTDDAPPSQALALLRDRCSPLQPEKNPEALWYIGSAEAAAEHAQAARDLWTRLLAQLPADAPVRRQVEDRIATLKPVAGK